ncbi:peptidoglycan editing factor PgeF [Sulfurimonas aquatica]|uniref:Purine nucleoside phosphorylase n=1 Tax=Sulfurimonas aquatica TaxID=2672570 RepID=A0A975B1D3_9BACT|nr:peptidoglycan editing factor PgeF [Sulfurimonas aquatica]QSZ42446.1 peptidoglycan editing factor PgeF [Sulfurimonas aquatica]
MLINQTSILNKFHEITYTFTTQKDLNLAFHVGDDNLQVIQNHENLAKSMGYPINELVHMQQIHSDMVHIVNDNDNFKTPPTCDALITNKVATPLMVMVADCSPILFYDSEKKVIAVAHAGRAGSFKNIVQNVVSSLAKEYNSKPENIIVSIGPSIKSCCYEVGSEIYDEAKLLNLEYSIQIRDEKYYLDISTILHKQLLSAGVKEKNIEISTECTCCLREKYYSYRAENKTGRFCGLIYLNAQ